MHVSLYSVTRHYGGPEEGGWHYDRSKHKSVIAANVSRPEARAIADALNDLAKQEKRQPSGNYQGRYSVAGHTDDIYMIEDEQGENDDTNEPRPHYE